MHNVSPLLQSAFSRISTYTQAYNQGSVSTVKSAVYAVYRSATFVLVAESPMTALLISTSHDCCEVLPMPTAVMGVGFSAASACLSVCFFPHDISRTDAAKITELDLEMFHMSSGNPLILGSKGQRLRSQGTKKQVRLGLQT